MDRLPPLQVLAHSLALGAPNLLGPEPSQDTSLSGGPDPLQQALPAPRDPPRARRAWGKLVWQQPGACGLGSGQGWTSLFEGSPSLGRCHMAALISAGGAHAPWGDGRRAGVTSSLQEPWSLGGSDRGARKRAAGGGSAAAGRSCVAPPGPVLGGQHRPLPCCGAAPAALAMQLQGCWQDRVPQRGQRAVGAGMPKTPALPWGSGCRLPAGWQPHRLLLWLMLKPGRRQCAWPCLPPSPSAWGWQLQQNCFSS